MKTTIFTILGFIVFSGLLFFVSMEHTPNLTGCKPTRTVSYWQDATAGHNRGNFTDISYQCEDGRFFSHTVRGTWEVSDFTNEPQK